MAALLGSALGKRSHPHQARAQESKGHIESPDSLSSVKWSITPDLVPSKLKERKSVKQERLLCTAVQVVHCTRGPAEVVREG